MHGVFHREHHATARRQTARVVKARAVGFETARTAVYRNRTDRDKGWRVTARPLRRIGAYPCRSDRRCGARYPVRDGERADGQRRFSVFKLRHLVAVGYGTLRADDQQRRRGVQCHQRGRLRGQSLVLKKYHRALADPGNPPSVAKRGRKPLLCRNGNAGACGNAVPFLY